MEGLSDNNCYALVPSPRGQELCRLLATPLFVTHEFTQPDFVRLFEVKGFVEVESLGPTPQRWLIRARLPNSPNKSWIDPALNR